MLSTRYRYRLCGRVSLAKAEVDHSRLLPYGWNQLRALSYKGYGGYHDASIGRAEDAINLIKRAVWSDAAPDLSKLTIFTGVSSLSC